MKSIRIVTDGIVNNTRVFDVKSGVQLYGFTGISIAPLCAGGDGLVMATITFSDVHLDLVAGVDDTHEETPD